MGKDVSFASFLRKSKKIASKDLRLVDLTGILQEAGVIPRVCANCHNTIEGKVVHIDDKYYCDNGDCGFPPAIA